MRSLGLLLAAAALAAAAPVPPPPSVLFGPLFAAVQLARVFPDGKTFADAEPLRPADRILADYRRLMPASRDQLRAFVAANFRLPADPPAIALAEPKPPLAARIRALWPQLTRQPEAAAPGSSAIKLPRPYVVPGGRFREIYYWDSYLTMLGLKADGHNDLVQAMVDDFTSLIERFGHVPNGTRTYYLSRSQPPFYALMTALAPAPDRAARARRLAAMRREHAFWMVGAGCLSPAKRACLRVVRMADGSLLNRHYDDRAAPRDESYAEDVATARSAVPRPATDVWRDLRAAAESGWDFSSRWLDDPRDLATIRTTAIVPVDLNSLLYAAEQRIAAECAASGDAACAREFRARADARAAAVRRWLWSPGERRFADHDWQRGRHTSTLSAAILYPMFVGLASPAEAAAVAELAQTKLLAPGGLRTTTITSGQQWDAPNGWAPLQWIAVQGLRRYGHAAPAKAIRCRFLTTVERAYSGTGKLLEKYDLETARPGGGGEYPTQDGFGWTNGVAQAFLASGARCPGTAP